MIVNILVTASIVLLSLYSMVCLMMAYVSYIGWIKIGYVDDKWWFFFSVSTGILAVLWVYFIVR